MSYRLPERLQRIYDKIREQSKDKPAEEIKKEVLAWKEEIEAEMKKLMKDLDAQT